MNSAETAEDFGAKLNGLFSSSMTNIAIITALEVGLFEALSSFNEYKSYEEIAEKAKLKSRYVKELLGALTMGGIVDINPENEKYYLPEHRRSYLNTNDFKSTCVQSMQLLPKLYTIREEVKTCFKADGPIGIPHSSYLDYSRQKSEINAMKFKQKLVTYIEEVDGLANLLDKGGVAIDMACGAGDSTLLLAERFPATHFVGIDLDAEQLKTGKRRAQERNLTNVTFEVQNIEELPESWNNKFDFLLSHTVVHDLAHPKKGLSEFNRVLKSDGICLIIDINLHTKHSLNVQTDYAVQMYVFSMSYCVPCSLIFDGGEGLGAAWGCEKAMELFEEAGFTIETQTDGEKIKYICKKK